ncbi:MAG: hypothetical protein Fur009_4380 [Candidatus Microgenomates bacterium]
MEIWLPDRKITVLKGEKTEEIFDRSITLEEYGKQFYQSLVDNPPKFLVSYPSEMIQVASWMRRRGWKGNFLTLPPSALHEEKNLQWATEFLQARQIDFDNNDLFSFQKISIEQIEKLKSQLGKRSIRNVVLENQRSGLFNNPRRGWINRYRSEADNIYWRQIIKQYIYECDFQYLKNGKDYFQTLNSEEQTRIIELVFRFYDGENNQDLLERLLIKFLIKKYRDPDNFSSQTTTNNDEYKQIKSYKKIGDVFDFAFQELDLSMITERFFSFLENNFDFVRSFYVDSKGEEYKRKVNDGLYLRHILRTMVNADLFFQHLKAENKLPDDFDYEVLIWATALHDAIEINQENGGQLTQYGVDDQKAEKISQLVLFLTPKKTDHKKTQEEKTQDFDRIWNGKGVDDNEKQWWQNNQYYLRLVKAADVLANLYETVDDIKKGKEDEKMKRSLKERFEQFQYRVEKIKNNGLPVFDAENWLTILSEKLNSEAQSFSESN